MHITIALIQFRVRPSDPEDNLQRMEAHIEKAARAGAQLVVFPEDAVTGPLIGQLTFLASAPLYLARCQAMATRYGVDLVPGSWAVSDGVAAFNTTYYINRDGSVAGAYAKINLWATERPHITAGNAVSVFPTAYGMVGLLICWDLAFPTLFTAMNAQGVELVVSPSYWSFTKPADDVDEVIDDEILLIDSLCTARAFENNIIFAYCNAAGELTSGGYDAVLSGRSQITHPHDKVVCKAEGNAELMLLATVSLNRA